MRRRLLRGTFAFLFAIAATLGSSLIFSAMLAPGSHENLGHGLIAQEETRRQKLEKLGIAVTITPVPRGPRVIAYTQAVEPAVQPVAPTAGMTSSPTSQTELTPSVETEVAYERPVRAPRLLDHDGVPITAIDVAGNPRLYVGSHIHWTCIISQVPSHAFADANCGPRVPSFVEPPLSQDQIENDPQAVHDSLRLGLHRLQRAQDALLQQAPIVLTGAVDALDTGDVVVVDGTVRHPIRGANAFGVERFYPAVHVDALSIHR